jgi:pimeloyl-ACP methyl ester carboxylesterase
VDAGARPWFERLALDVQEFSAAGVRTFAVTEGRRDAFPVLFLHGTPGGAFVWGETIKALGRARLAIAPDLPGWGRSVSRFASPAVANTPPALLDWVQGVLSAQGIERFDLIAHGSAVWPALELLMADPARVRRLGLISARLWSGQREGGGLFGAPHWTRARLERWLRKSDLAPDSLAAWRDEFSGLLGEEPHARSSTLLFEGPFAARFADYQAALAAYTGALLLLWGEHDAGAGAAQAQALTASLERPEVMRLAGAGSFPMLDAAAETAARLREFLE